MSFLENLQNRNLNEIGIPRHLEKLKDPMFIDCIAVIECDCNHFGEITHVYH
jgi:hypothetical protein